MDVNQNLAHFSDLAYRTAVAVYALALVLSAVYYFAVARESDKASKYGGMTQTMVWLGISFHGASVLLRGLATHRFPWGNLYEYVSMTMFLGMVVAAVILSRRSTRILWMWVLVPVLLLLFYGGTKLYAASAPVVPALRSFWLPVHVSIVSLGSGLALISGVASLLFLLRHFFPDATWVRPLPAADALDAIAYRCAIVVLPVFGLGVVLGAIWAESAWGRFWGWDPKETIAFVTWVLYAAYLHARATSGWKRTTAAYINLVAFVAMIFNLLPVNLFVSSLHSYAGLN